MEICKKGFICKNLGFVDSNPDLVCKLNKAIYGLKHASRAWYEKPHQAFTHFGIMSGKYDHSLFFYNNHNVTLYTLVYVDDILIIESSSKLIHELINKLHLKISLKKPRVHQYFLGIEVHHQTNGIFFLTQTKYIKDLLSR